MAFLARHSTLGVLLQLMLTGKISFDRKSLRDSEKHQLDTDLPLQEQPSPDQSSAEEGGSPRHHRLVRWDNEDDTSNPQNWSFASKVWITFIINLYTFTVYVGSSLYVSSEEGIMNEFGVNSTQASLGLALYVLGYGTGCLILSPLTEIPLIGRNPPYAISGLLFVILCIPGALVNNYPGLMVLRFLIGLMASPPLATSGATLSDIWSPQDFPFAIGIWAATTSMGPAFGPTLSSYAVKELGWRFASWELLICAGPSFLLLFVSVPETSALTILHYRAKRLREATGDATIQSEAEVKQKHKKLSSILWDAGIKPWEMNIKDPALLFTTFYFALIYGIYYTFFESLPLVFPKYHNFSPESTGLVFLSAVPGLALAVSLHFLYLKLVLPKMRDGTFGELENNLILGMVFSWFIPAGLFIYAWTSRPSIHWIVPTIGLGTLMFAMYFVTQSIFAYIPMIYPRYAASILAASSFVRSLVAFAAILFAEPMFSALGVSGGVSLLGGLTVLCAAGLGFLWKFGKRLRARSSFAVD